MKPGDLMFCTIKDDDCIYSSLMKRWIPVCKLSFLLSYKNEYVWFNSKGCFKATLDDLERLFNKVYWLKILI